MDKHYKVFFVNETNTNQFVVDIGYIFEEFNSPFYAFSMNYDYLCSLINDIQKLIHDDTQHEIYWEGSELVQFCFTKSTTHTFGDLFERPNKQYNTDLILNHLVLKKRFIENWSEQAVLNLLNYAFNIYKNDKTLINQNEILNVSQFNNQENLYVQFDINQKSKKLENNEFLKQVSFVKRHFSF